MILANTNLSGACTLIGKNNTLIAKTARLSDFGSDIKNYYHLVVFNCFIVFSLKKNFKFF